MDEEEATEAQLGKVEGNLHVDFELQNNDPDTTWVTKPVAESMAEAMDNAPVGAMAEMVYAALSQRLRQVLSPDSNMGRMLIDSLVHTAINFRSLNPAFLSGGGHIPTVQPNSGAGAGSYHSAVWGRNKDERLPQTTSLSTNDHAYAPGQDPGSSQDKGLLIAKLFADLEHHLPAVIFNITSKENVPIGLAGSAVSKRFYRDGRVISELAYRATLSVEATIITEDDEASNNLQAIVESAFGVLRDQVGNGAAVTGKSWQLWLPTRLTPSPITQTEAPWAQGDDKGGSLYIGSVGLENMMFEAVSLVARPVTALIANDNLNDIGNTGEARISLAVNDPGQDEPIRLVLGRTERLTLSNAPVTSDLAISQSKRVLEVRTPNQGTGVFEIIPRRTGEATLVLYDTGMTVPIMNSGNASGRTNAPLTQRKVVVSAC